MTQRRGELLVATVLAVTAVMSCRPNAVDDRVFTKKTGEQEQEVAGTNPPQKLGGPKEPIGGGVSFSNPRKTPHLDTDIQQLNEADLLKYLNGLVYDMDQNNGEGEVVACVHATTTGDTPCAPNEGALVYMEPEIGAHKWAHNGLTPGQSIVVARILNYETDDRKEKTFGFPAHRKVWWIVDIDPATQQPRSRFFTRTYNAQAPFVEQVGGDQPFFDCGHVHHVHHGQAIAKYVSCSQSLTMQSGADSARSAAAARAPSAALFHQASFNHAVPLPKKPTVMELTATWVTCDMGCCSTTR